MTDTDMDQLLFAIDMCKDHRMRCQGCLVAELSGQPYCPLYDHLVAHAMALLDDELWPPPDEGVHA